MSLRILGAALMLAALAPDAPAADKRPMTVADLFKFKRLSDPQISPDGKLVAYTQAEITDVDTNASTSKIMLVPADGSAPPRALTSPNGKKDSHPRWNPDGKAILFQSNRAGSSQLFLISLGGGEATQVTTISTGADSGMISPDGKKIAFVSGVYPEFSEMPFAESDKKNKEKDAAIEKSPVKAKVFTKLFYRHWVEYVGDKRQHLFVCDLDGSNCRDATPGDRDAYPTSTTFSTADDFCWSPDSTHLIFSAVPAENEAWSTNYDICRAPVDQPTTKWETLTPNLAADSGPKVSFDGKRLMYRAQKKAGYEADRWVIQTVDISPDGAFKSKPTALDIGDVSVDDYAWLPADAEGPTRLALYETNAETVVMAVAEDGKLSPTKAVPDQGVTSFSASAGGIAYSMAKMNHPTDIFVGGKNLTKANEKLLAEIDLPAPESVEVPVEGAKMQMWILKPPGFDPAKKYPVVFLVHGGPQGAWGNGWSTRWNPSLWAAQGYVMAMPNPRGSTGFGQKFVDEISGDWGGKCYRDLVTGLAAVKKLGYVDPDRIASAGGSFGGYMMDWFAVSPIAKEFKTLITHCSVFNFESMWGTTDELWFDEYEHGGLPWEVPGKYQEFSPHKKAAEMAKYKTPMLIIHNDLDFRCPIGQGHELFSTLQRLKVPSRFVNFPDEGHWVLKPKNSEYWHKEIFDWLAKYCPPGGR